MLSMDFIAEIRRRHLVSGETITSISQSFNLSRPTVRCALKAGIDQFCAALIAIREEIKAIETGAADSENNLLHNAPHTHRLLLEEWTLPYSKQQAFFPDNHQHDDKYWPPVARIDNVYGDRHVVCSCPPLSDYE